MPRKRGVGRPKLGADARSVVVTTRLTKAQYRAIEAYVASENRAIKLDGGDGQRATVSSWVLDTILENLPDGLARRADGSDADA
jgi:hypothetical protein